MSNAQTPPSSSANPIESLLSCRLMMLPIMFGVIAGGVLTIAGGYYTVYQLVTLIGNN